MIVVAICATAVFTASTVAIAAFAKGDRVDYLVAGIIGYTLGAWLYSIALRDADLSAIGPVTTVAGMLMSVAIGRYFFGEPAYSSAQWLGLVLCIFGILFINVGASGSSGAQ